MKEAFVQNGFGSPVVRWRKSSGQAGRRPPLLIMLHGRGADENDVFELAPAIDPVFAIASVRGPLAADPSGYMWSESRSVGRHDPRSLRTTIDWLRAWIDSLHGVRTEAQETYLFGFSAGMAMAGALLCDEPSRYAGAVLLSGTLPFDTDVCIAKGRLSGIEIFYGHGSFDTVIPADLVDRSSSYLENQSGSALTARRYPIAHEISMEEMTDISTWLVDRARHLPATRG